MDPFLDRALGDRLTEYLDGIGSLLRYEKRRASFAVYAMGLLSEGERKSVEPICARACGSPDETRRAHDRVLAFLVDSKWSDEEVRLYAAHHALAAMTDREPVQTWIIDDTGFLKQGDHSVGVQRQYTGTAGKTTNCQIGVSLTLATTNASLPVDFDLYLPEKWTNDPKRRAEARVPDEVPFRTKPKIALDLIDRGLRAGLPRGVVLADSAYGDSSEFREQVRWRALDYAVGIHSTTTVWRVDRQGRRHGGVHSVRELGEQLGRKRYRRVTWREGTNTKLWARFAIVRVLPAHADGWQPEQREPLWLVIEWPDGEKAPTKYYLATLPLNITRKRLVRMIKERYRTERVYEEMKGEVGLDHYEGRRYPGWQHHVSVALCCYAFVVAERARLFPPPATGTGRDEALAVAA